MANSDTLSALIGPGTGRNQINLLTQTTASEALFLTTYDNGTTGNAILTVPTGPVSPATMVGGSGSPIEFNLNPAILTGAYGRKDSVGSAAPYYSASTFDMGKAFRIRVVGQTSFSISNAGNTIALGLYQGLTPTLGGSSKIAALTAVGASTTSVNFVLESFLQWDSTTQKLGGYYVGSGSNGVFTAQHQLTNNAAVTSAAGLVFAVSATFGATSGNAVTAISEFSIEQV